MAATVNLPVAAKLTPAAEKVQTDSASSSSADSGAFSRALNEQMEKKQSSTATEPKKTSVSEEKQSVNEPKAQSESKPESVPAEAKPADADDSQAKQVSQDNQADSDGVDEALAASMQMPGMQQHPLRELIALSMQAGTQGQPDGNVLPQVANLDPLSPGVKLAEMMKLAGLNNSADGKQMATSLDAGSGESALPPGLLLLQQRIQQQLATQAQAPEQAQATASGGNAAVSADVAQLRVLESALQALTKASEQGDTKGLEVAREQLLNRLQLVQATNDGRADSHTGDQPNLLKSLMQGVMSEQGLKTPESGKMGRLAFQELLGKFAPQLQGQNLPTPAAANPAALIHGSMAMLSGGLDTSSQSMQVSLPTTNVNVPVNNQAWGQAIGERLQWMVKQDMQEAEIRLNPRHLGPIEVKISMNQDQATVSFSAHHVVTRDALESAVPRLREMFGDNGMNLVDVNVSHNSDPRGQQANSEGGQHHQNSGSGWAPGDGLADEPLLSDVRTHNWVGSNRMLDTYV